MSLEILLLLLSIAVLVSILFHYWKIPSIMGYILVGVIVGPQLTAWWPDASGVHYLAEFGIVFLLFTIGLEFSLGKLSQMKRVVFGLGGLQVLLCMLATWLVAAFLPMSLSEAFIVGGVITMSSTAIVSKQLKDQKELNQAHGHQAIGILLFQDLAVIPILVLIPAIADIQNQSIWRELGMAFFNAVIAIGLILFLGKKLLRPLFSHIAGTKSLELFTLCILLITLGASWLTHEMGLSLALGGFVSGILLGETEFRKQIEADIRPFKDVLLGLFFITLGMQVNLGVIVKAWPWVLLLLSALIIFKIFLISGLSYLFFKNKHSALRTGLVLAQGGEFGFAILSLALSYKLLPYDYSQVILGAILMSMVVTPLLVMFNGKIADALHA